MKSYFIFTIVSFLGLAACNQDRIKTNYTSFSSDSEIYELIGSILTQEGNDRLSTKYLLQHDNDFHINSRDSLSIIALGSLLTKTDIEFIFEQYEQRETFYFKDSFAGYTVINVDSLKQLDTAAFWSSYYSKYGQQGFFAISLPLFSLDKQTAIVNLAFCCGLKCAYGNLKVYKKLGGKWKAVLSINDWMS